MFSSSVLLRRFQHVFQAPIESKGSSQHRCLCCQHRRMSPSFHRTPVSQDQTMLFKNVHLMILSRMQPSARRACAVAVTRCLRIQILCSLCIVFNPSIYSCGMSSLQYSNHTRLTSSTACSRNGVIFTALFVA